MKLTPAFYRKLGLFFIGCALLSMLAAAGFLAAAEEEAAIYISSPFEPGEPDLRVVRGRFNTVGDVIMAAGIEPSPHDILSSPVDSDYQAGEAIWVQRAEPVRLITDNGESTLWTHQPTIGAFLADHHIQFRRVDRFFADNQPISFYALDETPLPATLHIGSALTVHILDGERELALRTEAQTVGEALADAGIKIYAADGVSPSSGEWLTPDMTIAIRRSIPLSIQVDGKIIQTRSHHTTPIQVLAAAGIGLIGKDFTIPAADAQLNSGAAIRVVRVTEDFRTEDEPIPYETVWQPTDQLEIDSSGVIQVGVPGILRRRIRIRYEDGVEVNQTPDGEWVAAEARPQIMGYGTNIVIRILNTPDGQFEYWRKVRMRVTSYTAASSGKAPDHPYYGITASGERAKKGIVAIDRSVVPWKSYVYVENYGVALAGDTGGGVIGRWIDLGFDEDNYESWSGYTDVYYLAPPPAPDQINYLIPSYLP